MKISQDDPFRLSFIVDQVPENDPQLLRMVKYFLAGMTIPDRDLWVNLSPVQKDRILPERLARTELGRDLLEQDYILKEMMSRILHPEGQTGKTFWRRVYQQASRLYGTTDLDFDMQHRIWIVPDSAGVFENGHLSMVMLRSAKLKVLLEDDYLAQKDGFRKEAGGVDSIALRIMRELVVPEIQKQVDQGEAFKALRQIYGALILSAWYKRRITSGFLREKYVNRGKVEGISLDDPGMSERIWQDYAESFGGGVFDVIVQEEGVYSSDITVRRYTSGGMSFDMGQFPLKLEAHPAAAELSLLSSTARIIDVVLHPLNIDARSGADYSQSALKDEIRKKFRQLSFRLGFDEWPHEFYAYYLSGSGTPGFQEAFSQVIGEEIGREKGIMLPEVFAGWVLFLSHKDFLGEDITRMLSQGPGMRAQGASFKKNLRPDQRYWVNDLLEQIIRHGHVWGEDRRREAVYLRDLQFIGDYEIRKVLEASHHNMTWLGEKEGEMFVIKQELEPSLTDARGYLDNESRILKSFSDARIAARLGVPVFVEFFRERDRDVLVMSYIKGSNLSLYLSRLPEMGLAGRLLLMRRVCMAVGRLHEAGYLHRDIKPENFLIDDEGNLYLVDFELALPLSSPMNLKEKTVGTRAFIPPQEDERAAIRNNFWTAARDIYALGKWMFLVIQEPMMPAHLRTEMFAGGLHFKSFYTDSSPETLWADVPLADGRKDQTTLMIKQMVRQAMEEDPEKRQRSVHEMIAQIDMIMEEIGLPAEGGRETGSDSGVSDTDSKGGLDMAGIDQVLRKDPVPEKVIGVSDCFDFSPEVDFSGIVPVILGSRTIKNALF